MIGCQMHRGAGEHDTLKSQLEKLRPEARKDSKLPTIDRFDERFPCPGDLPALALERIVKNLDAKSAGRLQCVSKGFRAVMDQTSPGLKLTLHPHQRAALAWMRMRERRDSLGVVLEPGWVELFASNDDDDENGNREEFPFYMQTSTGILSRTPPNYFSDSCGGALCDEPGLGKTVTVCALILATRGSYAPPPKGLTIKFEHPEKENMEEETILCHPIGTTDLSSSVSSSASKTTMKSNKVGIDENSSNGSNQSNSGKRQGVDIDKDVNVENPNGDSDIDEDFAPISKAKKIKQNQQRQQKQSRSSTSAVVTIDLT